MKATTDTSNSSRLLSHFAEQLEDINRQYHDYNKLHVSIDDMGQFMQVSYTNDAGIRAPLTGWLNMEQVWTYLNNYQRMFCMDPNRLDRFFNMDKATAIVPISRLRPTRKRPEGIANGFFYMRQAYQGLIHRRKPISIRPSKEEKGIFDIIDGNSTYFVAKQIGMKSIPIIFQDILTSYKSF